MTNVALFPIFLAVVTFAELAFSRTLSPIEEECNLTENTIIFQKGGIVKKGDLHCQVKIYPDGRIGMTRSVTAGYHTMGLDLICVDSKQIKHSVELSLIRNEQKIKALWGNKDVFQQYQLCE